MSVTSGDPAVLPQQPLPSISDFEIVKFVSSGAYGDVFLAKRHCQENSNQLFAVKRVAKKTLVTKNLIDQIRCERVALATTRCRHVVHLYYSLQTDSHVYLVMEYLCGGDLRSMLMEIGCMSQDAAIFYAAEVALALEYLHGHGIIHRDIKPDNMLVSASGHIKLTDFGLSQLNLDRLRQQQQQQLSSQFGGCGTPGGYQPSAEKRYPRTPRQLMSLAIDYSFGSADGCEGGGAGKPACDDSSAASGFRARRRATTAATATTPLPPPPPPPCFDESASPPLPQLDEADDSSSGQQPGNGHNNNCARVRFKSGCLANNSNSSCDGPTGDNDDDGDGVSAAADNSCGISSIDHSRTSEASGCCDELPSLASSLTSSCGGHPHTQQQQQRCQRLLGTPDYLAPELIQGREHGTPVDYWALGVCLFEFLTGLVPFSSETPEQVMENILGRVIPWPGEPDEEPLSVEAVSAIDGLLHWEPEARLTISDLRRHPMFASLPSWEGLHASAAPFVPDLRGDAQDTMYFEPRNRARASCDLTPDATEEAEL